VDFVVVAVDGLKKGEGRVTEWMNEERGKVTVELSLTTDTSSNFDIHSLIPVSPYHEATSTNSHFFETNKVLEQGREGGVAGNCLFSQLFCKCLPFG